jgi:hypothetical protein
MYTLRIGDGGPSGTSGVARSMTSSMIADARMASFAVGAAVDLLPRVADASTRAHWEAAGPRASPTSARSGAPDPLSSHADQVRSNVLYATTTSSIGTSGATPSNSSRGPPHPVKNSVRA